MQDEMQRAIEESMKTYEQEQKHGGLQLQMSEAEVELKRTALLDALKKSEDFVPSKNFMHDVYESAQKEDQGLHGVSTQQDVTTVLDFFLPMNVKRTERRCFNGITQQYKEAASMILTEDTVGVGSVSLSEETVKKMFSKRRITELRAKSLVDEGDNGHSNFLIRISSCEKNGVPGFMSSESTFLCFLA